MKSVTDVFFNYVALIFSSHKSNVDVTLKWNSFVFCNLHISRCKQAKTENISFRALLYVFLCDKVRFSCASQSAFWAFFKQKTAAGEIFGVEQIIWEWIRFEHSWEPLLDERRMNTSKEPKRTFPGQKERFDGWNQVKKLCKNKGEVQIRLLRFEFGWVRKFGSNILLKDDLQK